MAQGALLKTQGMLSGHAARFVYRLSVSVCLTITHCMNTVSSRATMKRTPMDVVRVLVNHGAERKVHGAIVGARFTPLEYMHHVYDS
jgi:hypothetical protein